jgi:hypothetical protein
VQRVGWVERSDTINCFFIEVMGFAGLNPSYVLGKTALKTATKNTATIPNGWD